MAAVAHFLEPASIAVIGASARPAPSALRCCRTFARASPGPLFAVGRGQSILDVDAAVELAVIAVPADAVEAVARECAEHGVAALLVISAGFEDDEGTLRRRRLAAFCRATGMRMIGPNCLGVAGPRLNATFARSRPDGGRVALLSQSGGVGIAALEQGRRHGIGLSSFVSIGDRADISSNDLLQWWEQDDGTDVIALYLESFGNPRRFSRIARRVGRNKPIVAVKAGRSHAGSRAAGSHTGALVAASDATVDALFDQAGVIRTDSFRELLDVAALLAAQPAPAGPRARRRDERRRARRSCWPTRPRRPGSSCPSRRRDCRALREVLPGAPRRRTPSTCSATRPPSGCATRSWRWPRIRASMPSRSCTCRRSCSTRRPRRRRSPKG